MTLRRKMTRLWDFHIVFAVRIRFYTRVSAGTLAGCSRMEDIQM